MSFIILVVTFGLWVSGTPRTTLYIILTLSTLIVCGLSTLHLVNYVLLKARKPRLFDSSLSTLIGLLLISTIFISWTPSFGPTPTLNCDFNLDNFKQNLITELKADSVIMNEVTLQEEPYFLKITAPRIIVINPTLDELDFKTLSINEPQRFDNYEELERLMKIRGEPYASELTLNCNMNSFNDIIIEFAKLSDDGRLHYRFINHYDNLLNNDKNLANRR